MLEIICFGDSITARKEGNPSPILTHKLTSKMPNYEFINAGVSGNTTEQAMFRFNKDVLSKRPDAVTVLFGANDSATHKFVDLETFKRNISLFAKQVGPEKTILISPAPVDESLQPNRTNERMEKYAQAVQEVAEETGSYFIDFFHIFYSKPNYRDLLVGEKNDGLHFGEAGYELLSDLIVQKLEEMEIEDGFFKKLVDRLMRG
ncbi:SGNH/GDSL hydrolase family protein [Psychrobacillus psychrodurans]|uniref:SGNH/GDSL hydrolase family protein n=1 Tax=Psychrobacillus psychrodurans TaxID=126157 RepID=UPI0008E5FFB9|nr:SGNH/GDSL hydrolase family protein [Psychrobacillus psychrodurans]MCZ8541388.1 SGNH/GDSL hydrolase family protein [Psychrobacillus psychrodurans]SFM97679.1 Lysophospholipase L1 [Psychrobacillus psychrodurans]